MSRIFKHEFIFKSDQTFDALFDATLGRLVQYEVLDVDDDAITIRERTRGRALAEVGANLLANFVDTYRAVGNHLSIADGSISQKDLSLALLEQTRGDFLAGDLICPEAVSKATVENAYRVFNELGGIDTKEGPPIVVEPAPEPVREARAVLDAARLRRT